MIRAISTISARLLRYREKGLFSRRCAVVSAVVVALPAALVLSLVFRESAATIVLTALGAALVYAACRGCLVGYRRGFTVEPQSRTPRVMPADFSGIYRAITEALVAAINAKESYSNEQVARVQRIAEVIASRLNANPEWIEGVRIAALLKDVGNLGVPDHILLKPGPLDPEEFAKVRNHAAIGATIVECVRSPWDLAGIIRHHHERYDGTGYPDRLKGEQIPLEARIISVAGVYDALISERCYRAGWSHHEAAEHIRSLSGTHFDPRIVKTFFEVEQQIVQITEQSAKGAVKSPDGKCATADIIAQANRELMSVFEISQTLSSTLELDEVVALLAHRTRRLTHAATCAVFVADKSRTRSLVAHAVVGRHQEVLEGACVRIGRGVTGKSAQKQRSYIGGYDHNDLLFGDGHRPPTDFRSCAIAPIVSFGEVLGTINIYDVAAHAFTGDDVRILTFVAQQAATAVENASAFEKVRESALRDPLTNLHNGRYLSSHLEREINRAQRLKEPLCVLGMDIDGFKEVNDIYGHRTGDQVLKGVANTLKQQLREYDVVARTGGDEFVVILPGVTKPEARRTIERIQHEVEQYALDNIPGLKGSFGMSVGAASYPDDALNVDSLLSQADSDMYRDKRARKQLRGAA